jgi:hypothetical protein
VVFKGRQAFYPAGGHRFLSREAYRLGYACQTRSAKFDTRSVPGCGVSGVVGEVDKSGVFAPGIYGK